MPGNRSSIEIQRSSGLKGFHLQRFLLVFEQVCLTMAYAHSRGVIHRDLKPANIMLGTFGEVQVMDWGLAKIMTREESDKVPPSSGIVADDGGTLSDSRQDHDSGRVRQGSSVVRYDAGLAFVIDGRLRANAGRKRGWHAGLLQCSRVVFAFVAQRIEAGRNNHGRRQPSQGFCLERISVGVRDIPRTV